MCRHTRTVVSERVASITARLLMGEKLRVSALAREFETTKTTIHNNLASISRVLPVYSYGGLWQLCDESTNLSERGITVKRKLSPAESLAELEKQIEWYQKTHPTNGGSYSYSITQVPKPIRDGIFFWSAGWGWRLRKNWQEVLEQRRKELTAA